MKEYLPFLRFGFGEDGGPSSMLTFLPSTLYTSSLVSLNKKI